MNALERDRLFISDSQIFFVLLIVGSLKDTRTYSLSGSISLGTNVRSKESVVLSKLFFELLSKNCKNFLKV